MGEVEGSISDSVRVPAGSILPWSKEGYIEGLLIKMGTVLGDMTKFFFFFFCLLPQKVDPITSNSSKVFKRYADVSFIMAIKFKMTVQTVSFSKKVYQRV